MGKKGKKGGGGKEKEESREPKAPPPQLFEVDSDRWMKLKFVLINWHFMDFTLKLRETTKIFSIKKLLAERHGHMADLKLCANSFTDANEITDEMTTLSENGLKGAPQDITFRSDGIRVVDDSHIPTYQMFYDFKPADTGDPVILFFKS